MLEFQVFFSDHIATGVPGSFHGQLFPKSSLHFVHSSYVAHWLSKVLEQVVDKNSPVWNKGNIYYMTSPDEIVDAYAARWNGSGDNHASHPKWDPSSRIPNGIMFDFLGSTLMEIAKEGLSSEKEMDAFNILTYNTTPKEIM
ncbi:hypothetical protein DVH24_007699 [Malus domestica]|uniref:Uncharacterized protein n=1 Tax=Malus domestica TaxID=3750 RepID=A0A498HNF4_MALDO|nr:hypothetical protein DVH24_007699 [Malus domestica]